MYSDIAPFLICPDCQSALVPKIEQVAPDDEILEATLACAGCTRHYPVRGGIADFLGQPRPQTPAQATNEWPITAWGYERLWRPFALSILTLSRFPYRLELPLVARLMRPERGGLFLDVACSNGLYARAIARTLGNASGQVAAIDHSMPMLVEAQRLARNAGLRISFVRAEAQALPFASAAVAGVAIGGSLNEIGDLGKCLSEVQRVLASKGRFVAMSLTAATTAAGRLIQAALSPGGVTFLAPDELIAAFADHGFAVDERESRGIVLFTRATRKTNHG